MKLLTFPLLALLLFLSAASAGPASAGPEKCPDKVLYRNLAVEGVLQEHGSADGYYVDLDLTPMASAGQLVLSLSVQDSENTRALMGLNPGAFIRVVYDMVREYDSATGECLVYGVVRQVETLTPEKKK